MKILIPVDFSPDSLKALQYALTLAKLMEDRSDEGQSHPELLIYHAFHMPIGGDATFFINSAMLDKVEKNEQNKLRQLVATMPEIHSISHRIVTKMTLPGEGILQIIDEESIDLVVMGIRGANESVNWLGSTAFQIMKHVSCPVLAVPRSTDTFHPRQVAFATDLEAIEDISDSLSFLRKLLQLWQANVQIIHVHPAPARIGFAKAEEALHLDQILQDIPHTYDFPEEKNATQGIFHYLQNHSVDLLVMIPRYHFALENVFHKSVTRYLTTHTTVPLLTLHEKL